jgi:hypothetical protein
MQRCAQFFMPRMSAAAHDVIPGCGQLFMPRMSAAARDAIPGCGDIDAGSLSYIRKKYAQHYTGPMRMVPNSNQLFVVVCTGARRIVTLSTQAGQIGHMHTACRLQANPHTHHSMLSSLCAASSVTLIFCSASKAAAP